jgi:hypothetical protein
MIYTRKGAPVGRKTRRAQGMASYFDFQRRF